MDVDVAVVGGGPSGLAVASELALGGASVVVLERRADVVGSRGASILPRVLELFDARGLAQMFIERARQIRQNPLVPYHVWGGMQPVEWRYLDSWFGYRLILPQSETEELLATHVTGQGVEVVRGVTVSSIEQDDSGVVVGFQRVDGTESELTARYVVGADGARSAVRRLCGIGFEGHDATFTGMIADAVLQYPFAEARRNAINERGWALAIPFDTGGSITRFTIVHAERRAADRSEPVTVDEVKQCAREILEEPELEFDELRSGSRYTDEMRLATRFRDRRVVLVGESTRVHYPASGTGMNFCIQDAFNLGWKLAMVINGHAQPALLDTYESERRPVTESFLRGVAAQCALQFNFSPEGIALQHVFKEDLLPLPDMQRRLALELNGIAFPYPSVDGGHPLTGQRLPNVLLQTSQGVSRVAELLRRQEFVLIDCTGEERYGETSFDGAPVRVISGVLTPSIPALSGVTSLLIRPDAYVAWADTGEPDPDRAKRALATWLKVSEPAAV